MQCTEAVNTALDKLRAAGVELVPFDSSQFDALAVSAWPGPPGDGLDGASTFESLTTLARHELACARSAAQPCCVLACPACAAVHAASCCRVVLHHPQCVAGPAQLHAERARGVR